MNPEAIPDLLSNLKPAEAGRLREMLTDAGEGEIFDSIAAAWAKRVIGGADKGTLQAVEKNRPMLRELLGGEKSSRLFAIADKGSEVAATLRDYPADKLTGIMSVLPRTLGLVAAIGTPGGYWRRVIARESAQGGAHMINKLLGTMGQYAASSDDALDIYSRLARAVQSDNPQSVERWIGRATSFLSKAVDAEGEEAVAQRFE